MADRPTASTVTDDELDALHADVERARDVAVALENDNRRLEDRAKEANERARVAFAAAHNLQRQTPDAAQRTLDRVRQARTWCDLWVQLGMYYGLSSTECGLEARDRRTTAEQAAEERAAELGKRLEKARARAGDLGEEHEVHRKALAHATGQTLCRNWDQLIESAGRLHAAATEWMADTKTAEARAERAEQQLADGWQQLTESGAMPGGTLAGAIKGLAGQRRAAIRRHDEAEQELAQVRAVPIETVDRWRATLDNPAQQTREDGHAGACAPPCCSAAPAPTEPENEPRTNARDR